MEFTEICSTMAQIGAKVHEESKLSLDKLEPAIYLFFTDYEDTETHCVPTSQITNIQWDDELPGFVIWYNTGENKQDYPLYPMGGIWAIEIK